MDQNIEGFCARAMAASGTNGTFWEVQLNEHSHDKTRQVLDASRCILISTSAVFIEFYRMVRIDTRWSGTLQHPRQSMLSPVDSISAVHTLD